MRRRSFLIGVAILAGCTTNRVASEDGYEATTVRRSDAGIVLQNLSVFDEGERRCYHSFDAVVINENDEPVEDLEMVIRLYNEDGQQLTALETGYRFIEPGGRRSFNIESGPQRHECWSAWDATDYDIEVSHETA